MSNEEQQIFEASFQFIENEPIGATFTIAPNIQDLNYTHFQDVPNDTWVVTHNLGKYPSVTIIDSAGDLVQTDIIYLDENTIKLEFNGAFAGKAFIN